MIIVARDLFDHLWYNSFCNFPFPTFALLWFSYDAVHIIGQAYILSQSVEDKVPSMVKMFRKSCFKSLMIL